ncbi:hypothetical protein M0805_002857 [Coniferiporia weirii]|nr:hypothetical protein M0805_002857 [Coniferiporia weirii]
MASSESLSTAPAHLYGGREAALPLHILVIGCGLGGLAAAHCLAQAGHTVTLIESARRLSEVGAGIQVSPNASRLLERWGLASALGTAGVEPDAIVFRRYNDGEVVGYSRWGPGMRTEHGAPYYHVHRADLHRMVYELAAASPRITLRLSATVQTVQPTPNPQVSVTLTTGEVISGDLIVGADGVKSLVRGVVVGHADSPEPTGDAAYRAIISTDVMLKDPELKPFVDTPEMTAWMGPSRHLMAYCIRGKKEYNLVMLHPDDGSVESWTAEGSAEKLREDFADYDPRVRKLLSFVDSTLKWRLMDRKPLKTWVHSDGRVVLLGDSCHPMLPYRAQGAAMALEDAAVIGALFSHLSSTAQIAPLLHAYEQLRHARTARTQASARFNQHVFHLPDGPAQKARDEQMRRAMEVEFKRVRVGSGAGAWPGRRGSDSDTDSGSGSSRSSSEDEGDVGDDAGEGNANQWADRRKNVEQFSYDADEAVEGWWVEEGEAMMRSLA